MPLVTIEGLDGSGKTTCVNAVRDRYPDALYTSEPDDDTVYGKAVRHAIKDDSTPAPAVFTAFLADHAHHYLNTVKPALEDDELVVCDRYIDSRYAYQPNALSEYIAKPDTWLPQYEEFLAESNYPEVSFTDIAVGARPEALFFVYLTRALNGGDEGLHPSFHKGDYSVNLQAALDERGSPLTEAARDPYAWLNTAVGYDEALAWVQSIQEFGNWSRLPDKTILLDITVDESFERKEGDEFETFEKRDFLTGVRENYLGLLEQYPERYVRIDGMQTPEEVCDDCLEAVTSTSATARDI